jgi:hypothetical protein
VAQHGMSACMPAGGLQLPQVSTRWCVGVPCSQGVCLPGALTDR